MRSRRLRVLYLFLLFQAFFFFFFVNFIYSGQMYENSVFSDIRDVRARTHSATMKFPYCALKSGCCSFCNGHPDFRWCWKMHFPRLRRISLYNHSNTSLQFFFSFFILFLLKCRGCTTPLHVVSKMRHSTDRGQYWQCPGRSFTQKQQQK